MYFKGRHRRFSPIELLILRTLEQKPLYGNEIIKELETKFRHTSFHARSGTIYPILKKLKKREWIVEEEEGEQYKKKYSLTEKGRNKIDEITNDEKFDNFLGFYHTFSDYFYSDYPYPKRTTFHLKSEIKRLERRKAFLEKNLKKINELLEKKKTKLEELEKDEVSYDIPIE